MKICYVCADPGIPIFGRKGCSTHVRETILTLEELGHEVRLVTPNLKGDDAARGKLKAVQVRAPKSKKLGFDLRHIILDHRMKKALKKLVEEWQPDAIYERYSLYSKAATKISRKYGLPRMMEVNAFLTKEQNDRIKIPSLAKLVEKQIFRAAPRLIVVSEPLKEDLMALGVQGDRIIKMPMAVNLDKFRPDVDGSAIREKHGLDGRFVFGYVGTLGGWHGIRLMYDMAEELKRREAAPFAFLIVGGDPKKLQQHRQRVKDMGLEEYMHFVGSVPHDDIPSYLCAMNAAIVPHMTYWSSPAKLFEYQACGTPSLAPSFPSIHETMVSGHEGFIFEPENVSEMADYALRLMNEDTLREQMGVNCRHRAEREHSWDHNAHEILKIFESLKCGAQQ